MCCAWPETSRCGETWCQLSASSPWSQLVTSPCTTACDSATLSHFDLWSALCTPKGLCWWLWRCWTWKEMPFSCGCCLESRWWSHWCSSGGGTWPLPPCFLLQTPPPATCRCIYEWIYIFLVWFSFFFLKCHCLELNHLVCSECYFNRAARKTGVPLQNQEPQTMSCVPGNGRKESHSDQL